MEIVNVVSVQNRCNPFDRDSFNSGVVAFCTRENIAFLPHSPVGGHKGHIRTSEDSVLCAVRRSPWNKTLPGLHSLAFILFALDASYTRREPHRERQIQCCGRSNFAHPTEHGRPRPRVPHSLDRVRGYLFVRQDNDLDSIVASSPGWRFVVELVTGLTR